jgi:UDP-3-O-[3-hydroxymyristoyl] glucosamine N-acyltransferase
MQLKEIAGALAASITGDETLEIDRIVHPADAEGPRDLAIALTDEAFGLLGSSRAAAAVVPAKSQAAAEPLTLVRVDGNERITLAVLTAMFDRGPDVGDAVHRSAEISPDARVAAGVRIGPLTTVGARSRIGTGGVLSAHVTVGADVTIGENCIIHPGVVIGDRTVIGDRVIIQANAVIGSDGFSFMPVRNPDGSPGVEGKPKRIHSVGRVVIGDDVEIGASTTIDRATLRETRIGNGTKIDNQVQIAHNVTIGESCLICGMVGLAGSVTIGDRAILAAGAALADHLTVGSEATLAAGAFSGSHIPPGTIYSGSPAARHDLTLERYMQVGRLRMLYPRVDDLKKRVEALEKALKAE